MKLYIVVAAFFITLISGCSAVKPTQLPVAIDLPESVDGRTGNMQSVFTTFFNDDKLKALIDTALSNNFDLQQALQRIEISAANTRIVNAGRLPQVSAVIGAGVERFGRYTLDGVGNFDTNLSPNIDKDRRIPEPTGDFFLGFRSSWEIDIWGKLKDRRRAAHARYLASRKGRQWLQTQLVADIARHYYELLALDDQQEILARNIALQQKGLELIESQMTGGRATALAVRQFKAQLLHNQGAAISVVQAVIETENHLNFLLGKLPETVQRDTVFVNKPIPALLDAGIPSALLLRRPDIQEAELELMASQADVQAARKAFFPSLSLNPFIGFNAFKLPLLISGSSIAAGAFSSLAAPMINRVGLNGGMRVANAEQSSAFYTYQRRILHAFQEVATLLKGVENLQKAYDLKTEEVETLRLAVSTATDLYLAGYANYLEVILAQGSVLQAELEQIALKREIFNALINLYRSAGGSDIAE